MGAPLETLKILDFSTLLPGPFATMLLADLGAEIIRIESPQHADMVRFQPPYIGSVSAWHATLNRSKRSLALDLRRPAAKAVVQDLIVEHDILLEQFRPGVMERLELGYERLRHVNERLIYCSLTGYGQTGPLSRRAGHDINYLALAGIASHTGRADSGPVPLGVQVADIGAGSLMAIMGILSAVIHRQQTGLGQYVDVSMFAGAVAWNTLAAAQYFAGGGSPGPETGILNGGSAYDYYRTSDGHFLAVGSLEPKFWAALVEAIDRPDLLGAHGVLEPAAQRALKAEIAQEIEGRSLAEWQARFAEFDACVEPVLTTEEMTRHPQTTACDLVVEVPDDTGTFHRQIGHPIKFSSSQPTYRHIGAAQGAHTDEILRELGYPEQKIAELRSHGAVA